MNDPIKTDTLESVLGEIERFETARQLWRDSLDEDAALEGEDFSTSIDYLEEADSLLQRLVAVVVEQRLKDKELLDLALFKAAPDEWKRYRLTFSASGIVYHGFVDASSESGARQLWIESGPDLLDNVEATARYHDAPGEQLLAVEEVRA